MDDLDICYECGGYGDDYFVNDKGDLVCRCSSCPVGKDDDWEPDDE